MNNETITILSNSFSLNMLNIGLLADVRIVPLADWQAAQICSLAHHKGELINAIGHSDTDVVVRDMLAHAWASTAKDLPAGQRVSVKMTETTTLIVAQYKGQRLQEGATSLPEGATIEFLQVQLLPRGAVSLLAAAELAYGQKPESVDSGETDIGGWPISGSYALPDGRTIGSWGPTIWESGVKFPNGMVIRG